MISFHEGWDVSKILRYALPALRHRGNDTAWVALLSNDNKFIIREVREDGNIPSGWAGLLCLYTNEASRGFIKCGNTDIAYCIEGIVVDPTEVCRLVTGDSKTLAYTSLIALTSDGELIAYRPITGLRNLVLGAYGFDLAIISNESSTINALGGEVRLFVSLGTIVRASRLNLSVSRVAGNFRGKRCIMEFIYLSRLDSEIDGYSVYEFRRALARRLALRLANKIDADVVIGMPETGIIYGIKVAEIMGKTFEYALLNIERHRSALREDILDKISSVHLKLSPVINVIKGKRVLLVDDSLLTGISIKEASQVLRHRAGAREVHVAIASPRIVRSCPYGIDMPPDNQLLANAFSNYADAQRVLEVDSLTWSDLNDLYAAADESGIGRDSLCTYCLVGDKRELDL
ncbi:Amidophosphoribosyltransferase [Vulcanisaeta moutnovskia 768-28]|uniref:Amidophosphoribosyltransferase n=1 Tax=Vulcanisaeta moutnovskia (strain 768-28) TaxID=985053 RepID=F0QVW4_VULM7|nr:Amidophosphoribosyltransferase [Vulcanisaeta moutnovskia 768-28]